MSTRYGAEKKQQAEILACSLESLAWLGAGAFIIFLLFCAFVFSRGSLGEILESLSSIVMDAERQKPFLWKLARYFIRLQRYYPGLVYLTVLLGVLYLADRKRRIPLNLYVSLEILMAVPYVVYYGFFWDMVGINYMLAPLIFPGLIAWLTAEHRDQRLFWGWYVPGIFFTLLMHFATDTGILTMSASCMVPSTASVLLLYQVIREEGQSWRKRFFWILLAVQFISGAYQRIFYVWGDSALQELTVMIMEGPLMGIRTTEENALLYAEVLEDVEELGLTAEDRLLVVGIAPWIYLSTDAECAAYSTWEIQEKDELLPAYYELHPEKIPTVI
ncbi:MAG: hypothetical protein LUE92_12915 [Clostridiales bacterium]|nr:hypothetical protein [Clostridiales bacterium]